MASAMSMVGLVALGMTGLYLFKINKEQQEMISELNQQLDESQTSIQTSEQQYAKCTSDLAQAVSQLSTTYYSLNQQLDECNSEIKSVETEIQSLEKTYFNCTSDLETANNHDLQSMKQIADLETEVHELVQENSNCTRDLEQLRMELSALNSDSETSVTQLTSDPIGSGLNSVILTDSPDIDAFYALLVPKLRSVMGISDLDLKLLYRNSRDGNSGEAFHNHTDGHLNTLILVQSKEGCVLGGYTRLDWGLRDGYHEDPTAFLYEIKPASNDTGGIFDVKASEHAVHIENKAGPAFGRAHDLALQAARYGAPSYIHPSYSYDTKGISICGTSPRRTKYFQIEDYEVFQVVPK